MNVKLTAVTILAATGLIAVCTFAIVTGWDPGFDEGTTPTPTRADVPPTERTSVPLSRPEPLQQTEQVILRPETPSENDFFGGYVAIDGTTMLVSFGGDDRISTDNGSVSVYELADDAWRHTATLRRSNDSVHGQFGYAVALSGDLAVIGSSHDRKDFPDSTGAAYIFERTPEGHWAQVARLQTSDCHKDQLTGWSVSVSGNLALIGAPQDSLIEQYAGAAYLFRRDETGQWHEEQKLTVPECGKGDWFGFSVALHRTTAVVGSRFYNQSNGAVWVFEPDETGLWKRTAKLESDVPKGDGLFGHCVALQHDRLAVGSWSSGPTYLFERTEDGTWPRASRLPSSYTIALRGDMVLLGTFPMNNVGHTGGSTLFRENKAGEWVESAQLVQSDGTQTDGFGCSVALSDSYAVVGAEKQVSVQAQSGAAYVFALTDSK
jgi:hypothetical protein